jgi:hypothetical protein
MPRETKKSRRDGLPTNGRTNIVNGVYPDKRAAKETRDRESAMERYYTLMLPAIYI